MSDLLNRYGFLGCWSLVYDKIFTSFFYKQAKIIRRPFECRGKKYISIGKGLSTGRYCRIEAYSEANDKVLFFGDNCQINDSVHIVAKQKIIIKDNVLIASRVFISDLNHGCYSSGEPSYPYDLVSERPLCSNPVIIGNNVWIGEGAIILPGVSIGDNSIIGANSVVSKSIEANTIYAGNPAVIIKKYNFETNEWDKVKCQKLT